jgi:hypothetical protein
MSQPKNPVRQAQVKYSWGILLGMAALPIFAVMMKVFPGHDMAWQLLMAACGLIMLRSVIGYVFPKSPKGGAASDHAVAHTP